MNTPHSRQSLWDFALVFYAQPKIAETSVHLQDNHKVNVCLLISLRWMDEQASYLNDGEIAALDAYIQSWTETVIKPLRSMRRLLKQPTAGFSQDAIQEQLRTAIKQAELLAEKKLLLEIEAWLKQILPRQSVSNRSNVGNYLSPLGVSGDFIALLQKEF
jgi:uncharacterized protein (TIGR02444 family)